MNEKSFEELSWEEKQKKYPNLCEVARYIASREDPERLLDGLLALLSTPEAKEAMKKARGEKKERVL